MPAPKSDFRAAARRAGVPATVMRTRPRDSRRQLETAPTTSLAYRDPNSPPPVPTYRNRALERSQLKDEYQTVHEQYELLRKQTEAESRYMGGDEEHTHLVKGLDYKLLEKVKSQLGSATRTEPGSTTNTAPPDTDFCFTEFGFDFYKRFFYHTNLNNVDFGRKMAKTLDLLSKGYRFRPHRVRTLSYSFDLGDDECLPSVVINADVSGAGGSDRLQNRLINRLTNRIPHRVAQKQQLVDAFRWHEENRRRKKSDRLPVRPARPETPQPVTPQTAQNPAHDSDDDIYQGVGKYDSGALDPAVLGSLGVLGALNDPGARPTGSGKPLPLVVTGEPAQHHSPAITYKIPEKLLKRSKRTHQTLSPDPDLDVYLSDSGDEPTRKRGRTRAPKSEWAQVNALMRESTRSVDDLERQAQGQAQTGGGQSGSSARTSGFTVL